MRERILKFLTTENISSTKFADEIGVQRSSISHILSGRNNPSFEFIHKILKRYKYLNAEWLIMGTGNMVKTLKQGSLFDNSAASPDKKESNADTKSSNILLKGSDTQAISDMEKKLQNQIDQSAPSRKIERVVLFFSDKTFIEFLPEN